MAGKPTVCAHTGRVRYGPDQRPVLLAVRELAVGFNVVMTTDYHFLTHWTVSRGTGRKLRKHCKLSQHRSTHRTHTPDVSSVTPDASGMHRTKTQRALHNELASDANSESSARQRSLWTKHTRLQVDTVSESGASPQTYPTSHRTRPSCKRYTKGSSTSSLASMCQYQSFSTLVHVC